MVCSTISLNISLTVPNHSSKHLHVSPWQVSLLCNIGSKGHYQSHVHNFSGVLLDWQQWTWFLTDLWCPLGINVCYRAVLCFGLLHTSAFINLRQSCWVFLFVWNVCLFFQQVNEKRNAVCHMLQPCCHPPVVRMQHLLLTSHLVLWSQCGLVSLSAGLWGLT